MTYRLAILKYLFFSCTILAIAVFGSAPSEVLVDKVHMLNVGQGDSFLIEFKGGQQILIDGGRDMKAITELRKVLPTQDRYIDVVIATHQDADHVGGLLNILAAYKIGMVILPKVYANTETARSLYRILSEKKIKTYYALHGQKIQVREDAFFQVLFPDRATDSWKTNAASVVGMLTVENANMLFTGDAPISVEKYLVSKHKDVLNVDVIKLGHHGSKTSTSEQLLKATRPALALISAGVQNSYNHPHPEVLTLLHSKGIPTISTQQEGTVTLVSNGNDWYVEK